MNDLSGEANSLFGPVGNDVSKLLGSLANHVGARFKRVLLDDIDDDIFLQLNGKVSEQALLYYFYLTRLTRFIPGEEIP